MKVPLQFAPECAGKTPTQVASSACEAHRKAQSKRKRSSACKDGPDYQSDDEFWCVFDHDDRHDFNQAWRRCQDAAGVKTATSNPCFELWLILHIEFFDRPDDQNGVQRHLESICDSYCRGNGKRPDLNEFLPHVETAERHAARQFQQAEEDGEPGRRPSTEVFKLVQAIREKAK